MKKDRSEGKITAVEPSLDSMSTLRLYESLKSKLLRKPWTFDGVPRGSMYDFYEEYWCPFGDVLVKMETAGMLVDRAYLSKIKKVAVAQRKLAADKFRKWASKYCPDAKYMNVKSHFQIRQLFFGGTENRYEPHHFLSVKFVLGMHVYNALISNLGKSCLISLLILRHTFVN
jgi:DNA polymerase-1